jgi:cytochrome b6-f complex iron-sulfur subunit
MAYPIFRYLLPAKVAGPALGSIRVGKVSEFKPNSGKLFRFGSKLGILIRTPSGEFRAFGAQCTHLGCTVQYRPDLEYIWCACHNGRFDLYGKNVAGPPPSPLEQYDVAAQGGDIFVSRKG